MRSKNEARASAVTVAMCSSRMALIIVTPYTAVAAIHGAVSELRLADRYFRLRPERTRLLRRQRSRPSRARAARSAALLAWTQ